MEDDRRRGTGETTHFKSQNSTAVIRYRQLFTSDGISGFVEIVCIGTVSDHFVLRVRRNIRRLSLSLSLKHVHLIDHKMGANSMWWTHRKIHLH